MKTLDTIAGKTYVVTSPNGCTVTDETGLTLGTVDAANQKVFVATGGSLHADDDSARITATFNSAPAKLLALGLLGGGVNNALPAGYLAAEFLESTGTQYIKTNHIPDDSTGLYWDTQSTNTLDGAPFGCRNNTDATRFLCPRGRTTSSFGYGWGEWVYFYSTEGRLRQKTELNYLNSRVVKTEKQQFTLDTLSFTPIYPVWLFGACLYGKADTRATYRVYQAAVSQSNRIVHKFMPALDSMGFPCMYDKVSKQPFYNSGTGSFIVGLTLTQARKLGKLPATGGTLSISLPTGYEADEGVVNALETARGNGWTLTIQTYEPEDATASTYALRRVWVRRTQAENGTYVDAEGTRWQVEWCVDMLTPDGSTPDAHGYELYRSQEAAVEYWGLEPWVDPNAEQEELLIEDTTNEHE